MRIFVGNLPFSATEDEIRDLFAEFGRVDSVHLITDRETGRPRGFGFVEMDGEGGAQAIEALHQTTFGGRALNINEARPRPQRSTTPQSSSVGDSKQAERSDDKAPAPAEPMEEEASASAEPPASPVELLVDPGSAPPEVVAEILAEFSGLFRSVSGSGVEFRFSESHSLAIHD